MPPRHGKSELISKWALLWYLVVNPTHRIILASYSAELASFWGRAVRELVAAHGRELGIELQRGEQRAHEWYLTTGGGMVTAGVAGSVTGKGADLVVIDDPIKNAAEAMSETRREAIWAWWQSTIRTRLEPGASAIVLQTRWHEADLAGRLIAGADEGEPWSLLSLSALAEENDPLGRPVGASLWPSRYNRQALLRIQKAIGNRFWAALYRQAPTGGGLGFFPELAGWQTYRTLPARQECVLLLSLDMTLKEGPETDFVSLLLWAFDGRRLWLVDERHERGALRKAIAWIQAMRAAYPEIREILVEDKALGPGVVEVLRHDVPELMVHTFEPRGSKEARAAAAEPFVRDGRVLLPTVDTAPWVYDFVRELVSFPLGAHDDRVDATTQMIIAALIEQRFGGLALDVGGVVDELDRASPWSGLARLGR